MIHKTDKLSPIPTHSLVFRISHYADIYLEYTAVRIEAQS